MVVDIDRDGPPVPSVFPVPRRSAEPESALLVGVTPNSAAVSCWPGYTSVSATSPWSAAASVIAPSLS